jgi:hypothetical protein
VSAGGACQSRSAWLLAYIGHLAAGSIRRGACTLDAEPLANVTDPEVLAALRALHPLADPPAFLAAEEPALQINADALCAVLRRVSAHNRGTAGGPTGWTYEMICAAANATEDGLRAVLRFVNLILPGALPRDSFVLESSLVGLQKPGGGVRPIAIGTLGCYSKGNHQVVPTPNQQLEARINVPAPTKRESAARPHQNQRT